MKKILFLIITFGLIQTIIAQSGENILSQNQKNNKIIFNRWIYGGNIGIDGNFGSNNEIFNLSIAPRIGYMLTQNLSFWVTTSYNFQNSNYYLTHIIGTGPELNYYLDNLYFATEFQYYFVHRKSKNRKLSNYNHNENALYIGGGYIQKIGNNAMLQIGLKYNILYNKNKSIFTSGFIPNIGFIIGI